MLANDTSKSVIYKADLIHEYGFTCAKTCFIYAGKGMAGSIIDEVERMVARQN